MIPPVGLLYTVCRRLSLRASLASHWRIVSVGRERQLDCDPTESIRDPSLGLFTWDDMSEKTAAANAGIENVTHVDYEMTVFLMSFRQVPLVAYGE